MSNLPLPLTISPERYMEAYNLDITSYVERHTFKESAQKGGSQIFYMSYSHAYRLFRTYFPELEVTNVPNQETGGYIHKEIDDRGYFTKPFVYARGLDGVVYSSPEYYYPILTVSGQAVYPNDLVVKKDYSTGKSAPSPGNYVADIQLFNKSIQRGLVKAIALTTGIGLKLWTGDDLDSTVMDKKFSILDHLNKLAAEYNSSNPVNTYVVSSTYMDTISTITAEGKLVRGLLDTFVAPATVDVQVSDATPVIQVIEPSIERAALAPAVVSTVTKKTKPN